MSLLDHEFSHSPDPFVIRGHHLYHVAHFQRSGLTPYAYATYHTTEMQKELYAAQLLGDEELMGYYRDNLGTQRGDAGIRTANVQKILQRYIELPLDHPLEIVTAKPDTLCQAAVIGAHCLKRTCELLDQDYIERDGRQVRNFAKVADHMGFGAKLEEFSYTATFTDSNPVTLTGIRTTMSVGRLVLANPIYEWRNNNKLPQTAPPAN